MKITEIYKRSGFNARGLLPLVACLSLALGSTLAFGAPGNGVGKMSDKVRTFAQVQGTEKINVIVRYKEAPDQWEVKRIKGLGGEAYRSYGRLPLRAVRIPVQSLEGLANGKDVEFITLDAQIKANSLAARETAGMPMYGSSNYLAVNPKLKIAVLDSGVDSRHADLHVAGQVNIVPLDGSCSSSNGSLRDEFNDNSFDGNDGTTAWSGGWIEDDVAGAGPDSGNVTVSNGELFLDDRPNTGTRPGVTRAANLSQATAAEFSFDFRTGSGVEADEDRIAVDISSNGGLFGDN